MLAMTNPLARFRRSRSFIAGLLIGLSIVVIAFACTGADSDSSARHASLVFGAPIILALGFALQVLATAKLRCRHAVTVHEGVPTYCN